MIQGVRTEREWDISMSGTLLEEQAVATFARSFGTRPTVLARAPGRVELLGNHTDYNGGLVLASTIDRFTVVAGRAAAGRAARFQSAEFDHEERFELDAIAPGEGSSWGRYVRGVVWALQEANGPLKQGIDAVITGNVPLGAGLSSSASLQASLALFLIGARVVSAEYNLNDDARMALARQLQLSENTFVGVASGLLDQFSVLFGKAGHALTLDCRSLEYDRVPSGAAIVVCDSKTSRRLADGMYNQRRAECERVVSFFQERRGADAVKTLRDVTLDDLLEAWDKLDPVGRLRARHVLTENERVCVGSEALRAGDLSAFGRLMSASHASSRDDFANSSPALDALVAAAERSPGFLGGKLSGAGWAGCTVNLVAPEQAGEFAAFVADDYARQTGAVPEIHVCRSAAGAEFSPC
jgi:galactokinase